MISELRGEREGILQSKKWSLRKALEQPEKILSFSQAYYLTTRFEATRHILSIIRQSQVEDQLGVPVMEALLNTRLIGNDLDLGRSMFIPRTLISITVCCLLSCSLDSHIRVCGVLDASPPKSERLQVGVQTGLHGCMLKSRCHTA
jgi:hypothetical protein